MKIGSIHSASFRPYGKIVEGYDFSEFLEVLRGTTCPKDTVLDVPSDLELEGLPVAKELADRFYGGMPIQIGYCNGCNCYCATAPAWPGLLIPPSPPRRV